MGHFEKIKNRIKIKIEIKNKNKIEKGLKK